MTAYDIPKLLLGVAILVIGAGAHAQAATPTASLDAARTPIVTASPTTWEVQVPERPIPTREAPAGVPEVDPALAATALSLLAGGVFVLTGRRRRRNGVDA